MVCLVGGVWGFLTLGRLEDPAFTIKQAVVETRYPGASAQQVAEEVSEPLESAIQKMGEVERIASVNRPGVSVIDVHVDSAFDGSELPAVWTKLRARVGDAAERLPPGAGAPRVNDGFGDVFGIYYAVTAEGFSDAEKHRLAAFLRRELLAVEGVADVGIEGLPEEAVFIEPNPALVVNLGVPPQAIADAIANANSVVDSGSTDTDAHLRARRIGHRCGDCRPFRRRRRRNDQSRGYRRGEPRPASRSRPDRPVRRRRSLHDRGRGPRDGEHRGRRRASGAASCRARSGHSRRRGAAHDLPPAPGGRGGVERLSRQSGDVRRHRDDRARPVHGVARGRGRRDDASPDCPRHASVHENLLHRDGAYLSRRPDHRDGDAGGQRHRGRRGHAGRHAAGQVLARGRRRGGLQNAGPASRGHRDRHHGVRRHRPQSRLDRRIPVFALRRDRHLAPAFLDARGDRDAAAGPLRLPAGRRHGKGGLRRPSVPGLRRAPARRAPAALADDRDPDRADGGVHVRFHPDPAAVFPGLQHAGLFRPLQAAAGDRHPARVRRPREGGGVAGRARGRRIRFDLRRPGGVALHSDLCGREAESELRTPHRPHPDPRPDSGLAGRSGGLRPQRLPGGRVPHPASGFRPRRRRPCRGPFLRQRSGEFSGSWDRRRSPGWRPRRTS